MWTYFIQGVPMSPVKIGKTLDIKKRLASLQTGNPHELRVLCALEGDREREMHEMFSSDRICGEWFCWSPEMESFLADDRAGIGPVWSMVNLYCTKEQREQFNRWQWELYTMAERLRGWVRFSGVTRQAVCPVDADVLKLANQLMRTVSRIPYLLDSDWSGIDGR